MTPTTDFDAGQALRIIAESVWAPPANCDVGKHFLAQDDRVALAWAALLVAFSCSLFFCQRARERAAASFQAAVIAVKLTDLGATAVLDLAAPSWTSGHWKREATGCRSVLSGARGLWTNEESVASECVAALGRYLDLGPVTRQRSSRNSFQVVCLTRQCFLPDADTFSQHLGLAVVPCQLRQGRGSDNRCSWRRTSPVTTKSSCSQQLQSTQIRLEYNRIPVLCSLTSGSARASPKGESFCKGIPNGAAREGAFVAGCVPRRRGTQSSPSILACQTLECLLR